MRRVLAIGAHPDDIEIGCGGTLLKLIKSGDQVSFLIATDGEEGSPDIKDLAQIRRKEAMDAAKRIGVKSVEFLGLPDGLTGYDKKARINLISLLRTLRPEVVFSHSDCDALRDHRVVHELVAEAIGAAAGPWYPESKGERHSVQSFLGFEVWSPLSRPQMFVSIDEEIEKKLEVIRSHKSQIQHVDYIAGVRGLASYRGAMSFSGRYAEAFNVYKTGFL